MFGPWFGHSPWHCHCHIRIGTPSNCAKSLHFWRHNQDFIHLLSEVYSYRVFRVWTVIQRIEPLYISLHNTQNLYAYDGVQTRWVQSRFGSISDMTPPMGRKVDYCQRCGLLTRTMHGVYKVVMAPEYMVLKTEQLLAIVCRYIN